jgi:hypothetical protein
MRVGPGHWRSLRLIVVASAAGTSVHIVLAPLVKAVGPPPVPARPPGLLVCLGAAPSPPRVLVVLVSLPGGSGGLRAGDCGVIRILPCPEKAVGDDALSDQVVCGKAAGLEQDRTAVGGAWGVGDGNVLVAPLWRGRAALVARRWRSAAVTSASRGWGRGVAAASAGPRLHGSQAGELEVQAGVPLNPAGGWAKSRVRSVAFVRGPRRRRRRRRRRRGWVPSWRRLLLLL